MTVPRPLLLVVDDTGWRSGDDRSGRGEAWRAGVDRVHTDADYEALAALAARLCMRVQCGMILCELIAWALVIVATGTSVDLTDSLFEFFELNILNTLKTLRLKIFKQFKGRKRKKRCRFVIL